MANSQSPLEAQAPLEDTSQHLLNDLRRVAKQAENCLRYRAALGWVAVTLLVLGVLMLLDCLFQREEASLRWMSFFALVAGSTYAAFRWWRPIWRLRVGPLDIARWIEAKRPQWTGRISTTVQLAEMDANDPRFGSPTFRQAVLDDWHSQPEKPNWDELINRDGLKRVAMMLILVFAALALSLAVWPQLGVPSLQRLLAPWSGVRWPRNDQLHFVDLPTAVGFDTILQVEVADRRPPLPNDIVIELRQGLESDSVPVSIPTQVVGEIAVASLPTISQDIQVRALGGDDLEMPWQTIRVVDIPGWKRFRFEIQPPQYLRDNAAALERLTGSLKGNATSYELIGQRIQVIAGSKVRFEGELEKSVRKVLARPSSSSQSSTKSNAESSGGKAQSGSPSVGTPLLSSATSVTMPWQISLDSTQRQVVLRGSQEEFAELEQSVAWNFRFETLEGVQLDSPGLWKVEVLPDDPPEITLESPPMKSLAIGAAFSIRGQARDDWGLSQVVAKLAINNEVEPALELPIEVSPMATKQQSIQQVWQFAGELAAKNIQLGTQDQVSIWLEARDLRGQVSKSQVERLMIESKQRQLENITASQSSLAEQLGELLSTQRSAQELARKTAQAIEATESKQPPTQQQLDAATSVNQLQQTIQQQLSDAPNSVRDAIDAQLALLKQNDLEGSQLASDLQVLKSKIDALGNGSAAKAQQTAAQWQAGIEQALGGGDKSKLSEMAKELDGQQSDTANQLTSLLEGMDSLESINRHREQLLRLAQQQEELSVATNQLNVASLTKQPDDFDQQIAVAVNQQIDLAAGLEQWLTTVLKTNESTPQDSSGVSAALSEAAKVLVDSSTSSMMRTAGTQLRSQQLGEALQSQKQVQQALKQAIDKLVQPESSELMGDLASREQRLRELGAKVSQLAKSQQRLAGQFSDPNLNSNLEQQIQDQQSLARQAAGLAGEFEGDDQAIATLEAAVKNQQEAIQRANENRSPAGAQQAAQQATQAAKKLEQLSKQIEKQAEAANQQVLQQQVFELASMIGDLTKRQRELVPQYDQLAKQQAISPLPADFSQLSRALQQKQTSIRDDLRQSLPAASQLQAFEWVLQQAEIDLTRALAAAQRNRLDPDAINASDAGLRKLSMVTEALSGKQAEQQPPDSEQENAADEQQKNNDQSTLPPLLSLKLIRALQLELKQQTASLDGSNETERRTRLADLTRQQQELGELLEQLIEQIQAQQE